MTNPLDLSGLRTSWTKYDVVQVINITGENELKLYINGDRGIDEPILRAYLGVANLEQPIPQLWDEVSKFPKNIRKLFALLAVIFTHKEIIELFATRYSKGDMQGLFMMEAGKQFTNIRSALVESGAAEKIYRRKEEVPYDLSPIFEQDQIGKHFIELLVIRFKLLGVQENVMRSKFLSMCIQLRFHEVLSLTESQFESWGNGYSQSLAVKELAAHGITYEKYNKVSAIVVKQWLHEWDQIPRLNTLNRKKPEPKFYIFSLPALLLKRLYGVQQRRANIDRKDEVHSQRKHSEKRSLEIREYVKGGFPWSTISEDDRTSTTFRDLRMPGWLPTSIIANILSEKSSRRDKVIQSDEVLTVSNISGSAAEIILPAKLWSSDWKPLIAPIEIIDGQHRIKAFDSIKHLDGDYELPIVAFHDLDYTWQAYLFYTINIKPKRINTSLAYDLIPLLRIQEWLEKDFDGPEIYRKVRAQEITETLWKYPQSVWYDRINMLGDTNEERKGPISQNAYINSLITSFVKKWDGKMGGLFGGELNQGRQDVIQWDKETQSAFVVLLWQCLYNTIRQTKAEWAEFLRSNRDGYIPSLSETHLKLDLAFVHKHSFFTTDQGLRPILFVFNDMCFVANQQLRLNEFEANLDYEKYSNDEITEIIIDRFRENKTLYNYLIAISKELCENFDWRTPSAFNPDVPEEDRIRQNQNQFKGSGGYREFRRQLMKVLAKSEANVDGLSIAYFANEVNSKLGF